METALTVADLKSVGFRKSRGYYVKTLANGATVKVLFAKTGSKFWIDEVPLYESMTPRSRDQAERLCVRLGR